MGTNDCHRGQLPESKGGLGMRRLHEWIVRFGGLFNKERKDRELDEEIESHLQLHIEENLRLGMSPEEARRGAMIKLGGIESTKEAYRDQRGLPTLETLWQDIRYGARMMRKHPGFTAVAVLTLALGIGSTSSVLTLVQGVLLTPPPYPRADQIMLIWPAKTDGQPHMGRPTTEQWTGWQKESTSFEA